MTHPDPTSPKSTLNISYTFTEQTRQSKNLGTPGDKRRQVLASLITRRHGHVTEGSCLWVGSCMLVYEEEGGGGGE